MNEEGEEEYELRLSFSSDTQPSDFEIVDEVQHFRNMSENECGSTDVSEEPTKDVDCSDQSVNVSSDLNTGTDVSYSSDASDCLNDSLTSNKEMSPVLAQSETFVNFPVCDEYTLFNTLKNIFGNIEESSEVKKDKELETCSQLRLEDSDYTQTTSEEFNEKADLNGSVADKSVEGNTEIVGQSICDIGKKPDSVEPSSDVNLSRTINAVQDVSNFENRESDLSNISMSSHEMSSLSVQCGNFSCENSNQISTFDVSTQCNIPDILGNMECHVPTLCEPRSVISQSVQCDIGCDNSVPDKSHTAKLSEFPSVLHSSLPQQNSVLEQCSENLIVTPSQTSLTDTCYCCCRVFKSSDLTYFWKCKPNSIKQNRGNNIKTKSLPLPQNDTSENHQQRVKNHTHSNSAVNGDINMSNTKFCMSSEVKNSEYLGERGENSYGSQTIDTGAAELEGIEEPYNIQERDKCIEVSSKNKERTSTDYNPCFNSLACEHVSSPEDLDDELPLAKTNCAQYVEKILSTDYTHMISGYLTKEKMHQNTKLRKKMPSVSGLEKTIKVSECVVISDSDAEVTSIPEALALNKGSKRKPSFTKNKNMRKRVSEDLFESRPTSTLQNTIKTKGMRNASHRHSLRRRTDLPHQNSARSLKYKNLVFYDSTSTECSPENPSPRQRDSEESFVFIPCLQQKKSVEKKFTDTECEQILKYIINHRAYKYVSHDAFWKTMKAAGLCKKHSWVSMKKHFETQLRFQIKKFNLGSKIEKRFNNIF